MSFKILRENNYLPFMIFYYWKSLFKIQFGYKNFISWPIFKNFAGLGRTNWDLDVDKKIFFLPSKRQKFPPKMQYLRLEITH